jgi:hypothetical protein
VGSEKGPGPKGKPMVAQKKDGLIVVLVKIHLKEGEKEQRLLIQQSVENKKFHGNSLRRLIQNAFHRKSQKWKDKTILTAVAPINVQIVTSFRPRSQDVAVFFGS